jgi:anti-sigma B factor antagonist
MNAVAVPTETVVLQQLPRRVDSKVARGLLEWARGTYARGVELVVLDLSQVDFIDSLGIATLCAIARAAPGRGGLALAALSPYATTIARVTHLHEVLSVYATVDAALRAPRAAR